ncbi:MAG: DegT/DnrJ/EryC1/StrS family aminotransferase [Chloroflexota bacterium]
MRSSTQAAPRSGHRISIARPVIGRAEIGAVNAVLRSGSLVQGAITHQFEQRFAEMVGTRYAIAVNSGTAALHLALLAHGIGPGDEVITSPFSFVATANAILYTGARPVFVDIDPDTFNIDPDQIEAKVTNRTRAIIPVHLYGHPANMDPILEIARRHGLHIVEDAAQAHLASIDGRQVGTFGTGCFSFYATKNVTTAEGGVITTSSDQIAELVRMLRAHGQSERYRHEMLGFNYRLTDLQAALGLVQLDRLEKLTRSRIKHAEYLTTRLRGVETPTVLPGYRHVYHQYTIRVPAGRDVLARRLNEAGVGTGIHYPIPIHQQPLYRDLGYDDCLPEAERASREVLSLPVHPLVTERDLGIVVERVTAILARLAPRPAAVLQQPVPALKQLA